MSANPQGDEATASASHRLTYRNGSGYSTLDVVDYRINDHGQLVAKDVNGRRHVYSAGADWKLSERR